MTTWSIGPRPPLRYARKPPPDLWRVVAYDFEGKVRFVAAEFSHATANAIAGDLIAEPDVASVAVERVR